MTVVYPRKKKISSTALAQSGFILLLFFENFLGFSNMKMEWVERC